MKEEERKRIAELYDMRLTQGLPDYKVVGWGSKETQDLRFKILSEIGSFKGMSVLDVGCGLADFYFYLKSINADIRQYHGIDISKGLIESAQKRLNDEKTASVEVADISKIPDGTQYDLVVLSGALNLKIGDNWAHSLSVLSKMFALSKVGVACNFLSTHVDFSHEKDFHHDPSKILDACLKLTRKVILRHDYPLYEFTVYLFK